MPDFKTHEVQGWDGGVGELMPPLYHTAKIHDLSGRLVSLGGKEIVGNAFQCNDIYSMKTKYFYLGDE